MEDENGKNMQIFDGRIELNSEHGTIIFYVENKPWLTISKLPAPLPFMIATDLLTIEVEKALCSWEVAGGSSGRVWQSPQN